MPGTAIQDDQGNVASNGSSDAVNDPLNIGFGAAWRRFLQAGIYNGDFGLLPPDITQILDNVNNALPYWSFVVASGNSVTAQVVANAAVGSGFVLQFTLMAGSAGDSAYIEQIVPVGASNDRAFAFLAYQFFNPSVGSADAEAWTEQQYLKSDGVTTTGTDIVGFVATSSPAQDVGPQQPSNPMIPADAYYLRIRFGLRRRAGGANSATSIVNVSEVWLLPALPRLWFAEISAPGTYGPGYLRQINGAMDLVPDGLNASQDTLHIDTVSHQVWLNAASHILIWDGTSLTWPSSGASIGSATSVLNVANGCDIRTSPSGATGTGLVITKAKAGAAADTDFGGSAVSGALLLDGTSSKIWGRIGAGWKSVAIAGERVPVDERQCPECLRRLDVGDELVTVANEWHVDGELHMFWKHRDCRFGWRLLKRLGLVRSHVAELTARLRAEAAYREFVVAPIVERLDEDVAGWKRDRLRVLEAERSA